MPRDGEEALFPLFLKLRGRRVLVVGAGAVAERKIATLVGTGAEIVVVAPEATASVRALADAGAVTWCPRAYARGDAEGAWLVIAATTDPEAQREVAHEAESRRIFILAVDDKSNASAYGGAIVERPPFTIVISSSGAAPGLTRLLREILEQILPSEEWVAHATRLREHWLRTGTPMQDRFGELVRELAERAR